MSAAKRIASALGDAYQCGAWWRSRCPAHSSLSASLALRDGQHGLIVVCHAGCPRPAILAELHRQGLLDVNAGVIERPDIERCRIAEARDRQRRIAVALDLWSECHPPHGTLVATYWRSRGLQEPLPPTLRMHGLMRHRESGGSRPAMVGLVEHVEYGPVGVHITYLAIDGSMKASVVPAKRSLGPVGGGAVRLAQSGKSLIVAEGIETAASAMRATTLPVWAALSTSGLVALVLPPIVHTVIILADNDVSGAGERAAGTAAYRWLAEGRRVRIAIPPEPGTDFNDVLVAEARDVAA